MIEVGDAQLEQKRKEAAGEAEFTKDALLDAIAPAGVEEYNRLPPRWRTLIGYHLTAKRHAAALASNSPELGDASSL